MAYCLKRIELYLYFVLTVLVFAIPTYLQYMAGYSGQKAAQLIALPFLVWVVISAYYLARWSYHKLQPGRKDGKKP